MFGVEEGELGVGEEGDWGGGHVAFFSGGLLLSFGSHRFGGFRGYLDDIGMCKEPEYSMW